MPGKGRIFPFATLIPASFIFVLLFGFVTAGSARARGPRVEVVCPSPPIPVRIDKHQVLVYELHVTNFDTVPLILKRLEVFANEESSEPLITLSDAALSAQMMRVGEAMAMAMAMQRPVPAPQPKIRASLTPAAAPSFLYGSNCNPTVQCLLA